jgi:hypothetical protein
MATTTTSMNELSESVAIRNKIVQARQLLNPPPVKTGRIPKWLKSRLLKAVKEGRLKSDLPPKMIYVGSILLNNPLTRGIAEHSWLDHWGTSKLSRQPESNDDIFVSEPYHISPESMEKIHQFAKVLDLGFVVLANSWHYPGATFRIEFYPREADE